MNLEVTGERERLTLEAQNKIKTGIFFIDLRGPL